MFNKLVSIAIILVFRVCVGDYYGKGNERITELIQSCKELGVPPKNVTIIDDK